MQANAFATLVVVHRTRARVRFRFATMSASDVDPAALARDIENLRGVVNVRLNSLARSIIVEFKPDQTDVDQLTAEMLALKRTDRRLARHASHGHDKELLTVAATGALLLATKKIPASAQMPATLIASVPLYREAFESLVTQGIDSHVLEALAVGISTASKDFTAANATVFMLALGEYLENSIARRSDEMLKNLLHPNTDMVWVERNGNEHQVPADEVVVGDTVIVGAGAAVPVDGTVLGGEALVNEAAMTGESVPVTKQRGARALSGTLLEEGRIRIYAERVGSKTAAARIADYVEQSLTAKSQAQLGAAKLADKLVPGVLGLAAGTWLLSGDWRRAAAVLQADYACALKLATPVAFKSAMYKAGEHNILIKGADALERLAQADTFVFDKTGTLTTGKLAVTDSITFDPKYTAKDLIDLAASIEEHYFHPLAMAVVEAAKKNHGRHFDHKEVEFIAAHGVASMIDDKRIVVGSRHFVQEDEGIPISTSQCQRIHRLFSEGKTVLYIGYGGKLLGVIGLKDQVRAQSAATLRRLKQLGVKRLLMLTGDHRDRAAELAKELGIDEFHAELLPQQKAQLLASLKQGGAKIAFVGDGINDAPALACAHVGIAMQQGADIARLTSDIALLEDGIEPIARAKELANATMRLVDTNFKLTVGLNTTILAAASLGKLSPIASSIAHNGTTIAILLNALRGGRAVLPT